MIHYILILVVFLTLPLFATDNCLRILDLLNRYTFISVDHDPNEINILTKDILTKNLLDKNDKWMESLGITLKPTVQEGKEGFLVSFNTFKTRNGVNHSSVGSHDLGFIEKASIPQRLQDKIKNGTPKSPDERDKSKVKISLVNTGVHLMEIKNGEDVLFRHFIPIEKDGKPVYRVININIENGNVSPPSFEIQDKMDFVMQPSMKKEIDKVLAKPEIIDQVTQRRKDALSLLISKDNLNISSERLDKEIISRAKNDPASVSNPNLYDICLSVMVISSPKLKSMIKDVVKNNPAITMQDVALLITGGLTEPDKKAALLKDNRLAAVYQASSFLFGVGYGQGVVKIAESLKTP